MAKGKKYNDDIRERAKAMLVVNNNTADVARKLNLPRTTVINWEKEARENGNLDELRRQQKERFIRDAWKVIELATKRVQEGLEAGKIAPSQAATVAAIYFDKQALAVGDPTQNIKGDGLTIIIDDGEGIINKSSN